MMEQRILSLSEIRALCYAALSSAGAGKEHAQSVTDAIVLAERDGCVSHGVFRLPGYLNSLKSGKVRGEPVPALSHIAPSVLKVDADTAFASLALQVGLPSLIELTRTTGIAALAITNTHHFAALWPDTEPLADAGLAAFACTANVPAVAPFGARAPFFGTNPISFAWPRAGGDHLVLDMATSAIARGDLQIADRDGIELPEGTGIDAQGQPATDPAAILQGAQLPFGGYKGSAIALIVELLSAGLIGEAFSDEAFKRDNQDGGPPPGGELIVAMDPEKFGNAEFWQSHVEEFLQRFEALAGSARLPGSRRRERRRKLERTGISVPESLLQEIARLAGT